MHLVSLHMKRLGIAALLAGFTFVACGEDAPATREDSSKSEDEDDEDDDETPPKRDAGRRDARADDDEDDDATCMNRQTRSCDDCEEDRCLQTCSGGEWGECRPVPSGSDIISGLAEAGIRLPDASVMAVDGGVSVSFGGDASVTLPTAECPGEFQCASRSGGLAGMFLSTALMGASFCAGNDMIGLPPACMTAADCMGLGFSSSAMCYPLGSFGSFCIQFCQ